MKAISITATALSVLLGITVPVAFGQGQRDDRQDRSAAQHQQADPQQGTPSGQRSQQQPAAQPQQRSPQQSSQRDGRPGQAAPQQSVPQSQSRSYQQPQQRWGQPEQSRDYRRSEQGSAWQQHRAGNWESDHRSWQQRGGYSGYRIPTNRFNGYFGPSHPFRIRGLPFAVVGGYPRFRYDGYWLTLVDPWPGTWASDWYDSDDVYVVFGDGGYYLYNRRYPNVGLAIRVSF
jgi:hypothetical protein